jgi:hypothetical protein
MSRASSHSACPRFGRYLGYRPPGKRAGQGSLGGTEDPRREGREDPGPAPVPGLGQPLPATNSCLRALCCAVLCCAVLCSAVRLSVHASVGGRTVLSATFL